MYSRNILRDFFKKSWTILWSLICYNLFQELEQRLVHNISQVIGWRTVCPLHLPRNLLSFLLHRFPGALRSLPEILWCHRGWAVQRCLHVHTGSATPLENSDRRGGIPVRAASAREACHPSVLGGLSFPGCDAAWIKLLLWFSDPLSTPFLLSLPVLCHSWCIHASLASSHCGRNFALICE